MELSSVLCPAKFKIDLTGWGVVSSYPAGSKNTIFASKPFSCMPFVNANSYLHFKDTIENGIVTPAFTISRFNVDDHIYPRISWRLVLLLLDLKVLDQLRTLK